VCVTPVSLGAVNEALWHLHATSLTLNNLTYNGVVSVPTAKGPVNVLDFTSSLVDVDSMVTYSANPVSGKNVYANGGPGPTVTLTNVHLHVLKQTGSILGIPVTLEPGSLITDVLGVAQGVPVPIPIVFTDVDVDQFLLQADTLVVNGFNVKQDQ
jgi:hypothetical protein